MKLRAKFNLAIIVVFGLLAVGVSIITVRWVDLTTFRNATERVRLNINSAWLVYDNHRAMIERHAGLLATEVEVEKVPPDSLRERLEDLRARHGLDVLNLIDTNGRVLLRTNPPYHRGDALLDDPMVMRALSTGDVASGTILLTAPRLELEGDRIPALCRESGGEATGMLMGAAVPLVSNGRVTGILQAGVLLNGETYEVDQIRDMVFDSQSYDGKPLGTATIFMRDLRIATNVVNSTGQRAIGTRVSDEVAEHVLEKGLSWTGRAWVVDAWYLSQYDPIRGLDGEIIGMLYVGELEKKYTDIRTRAIVVYLSTILASTVLAYLVFLQICRSILNPVQQLVDGTRRIADGDLAHRLQAEAGDEIGDLSRSFNDMGRQLHKHRQEIRDQQQALESVNEELRATNRNYMEMLGFVSHELRNPLASSIMSIDTLRQGYLGPLTEAQEKMLTTVDRNLHYFLDMIGNYLDMSRLEKGEINLQISIVALFPDVVSPIVEGLQGELQSRGMTVENRVPGDMMIAADPNLVKIVYDNLLANAVKYGSDGGTIALDAQEVGGEVVMSVLNEGPGIPRDKIPQLFAKFGRIKDPRFKRQKGTGLGLYICKEIVEKHGGRIWADSEDGQWAKFTFALPADPGLSQG